MQPAPTSQRPAGIDPRLFQIMVLGSLLVIGVARFHIATSLLQGVITLAACLGTQIACSRLAGRRLDWRSPVITAASLTLLLRATNPLLWAAAGIIGIGAKFALRARGKHLFNPACCGITALLLTGLPVWVSPGQWGALGWGIAAIACAAGLVLTRAARWDTACAFLASWCALLALRRWSLGDPWTIPLHQLQSGALLVFACFMITDPRSTPDARVARILAAMAVAGLGYALQFRWQVREGLYYALMAVSLATPLLDAALPARRFTWTPLEA